MPTFQSASSVGPAETRNEDEWTVGSYCPSPGCWAINCESACQESFAIDLREAVNRRRQERQRLLFGFGAYGQHPHRVPETVEHPFRLCIATSDNEIR